MTSTLIVLHERLGVWARQLRPRLDGLALGPIRWVESRSSADLVAAVRLVPTPLVLIDVADRPRKALEDLDTVAEAAPGALILVLDRRDHPGLAALARELGATLVHSGPIPPPEVAAPLARWLPIARRRTESGGWSPATEIDPTPWDALDSIPPGLGPHRS